METVYRVVPYQSVTKAVFYYSMGFYSGAKSLLDNSVQHDFRNTELNTAIASLRNQAATKTDRPGAGKIDALQAGNALQAPYSSVLWAIENGHTDQDVVRGLLELFRMQN